MDPWYATERVEMLVIVRDDRDVPAVTDRLQAIGAILGQDSHGPVELAVLSEPRAALLLHCLRDDFEAKTDELFPLFTELRDRRGDGVRLITETKTALEAQTKPIGRFLADDADR